MNKMNKMNKWIFSSLCLLLSTQANSSVFNFTGEIEVHNEVIDIAFTLENDAENVRVWTDSYQGGINFDPITALWNATDGSLIAQNDDDSSINTTTQSIYDSGFTLSTLESGDYIFTIATYNNFAAGTALLEGFAFDSEQPVSLVDWCQPVSSCNMGPKWSVWLDGVDSAIAPIPEPSTYALMLGGLGLVGFMAYRRKENQKS